MRISPISNYQTQNNKRQNVSFTAIKASGENLAAVKPAIQKVFGRMKLFDVREILNELNNKGAATSEKIDELLAFFNSSMQSEHRFILCTNQEKRTLVARVTKKGGNPYQAIDFLVESAKLFMEKEFRLAAKQGRIPEAVKKLDKARRVLKTKKNIVSKAKLEDLKYDVIHYQDNLTVCQRQTMMQLGLMPKAKPKKKF